MKHLYHNQPVDSQPPGMPPHSNNTILLGTNCLVELSVQDVHSLYENKCTQTSISGHLELFGKKFVLN